MAPGMSELLDVKKVSKKIRIDELDDAIVGGVLKSKVGDTIIMERASYKKGQPIKTLSFCVIKAIDADGCITVWDETRQQSFIFNVKAKDLPKVKVWLQHAAV